LWLLIDEDHLAIAGCEEKILANELTGYTEYQQKVQFRLLPMIW
jgi:protein-S-isoprenylcysteine O-methyltransferase Ste14